MITPMRFISLAAKAACNLRKLASTVLGVLVLGALSSSAQAQSSVTLAWNPSASTVVGYRLYQGGASQSYTNTINAGNATSLTVSGLKSGVTYYFAATAYDANNVESPYSNEIRYTVPATTVPPTVALTSPANGASFTAPATINCAASVTANGQTITKVQFYNGSTLLGEDSSAPYSFTWSNVGAGSYSLSARAVYGAGSTVASAAATVNVSAASLPPAVALTSPASGASFTAPATINCAASVTANGHTITKVQFYNGTALLGEDLSAPYSFAWNNVSAGSYSLSARAVYDSGSTVTSPAASVSVAGSLPAPWKTMDIGSVGMTGSVTSLDSVFTLRGAGNIGGTSDSFRYVYQPMSGDGGIRVSLQAPQTAASGVVGVMIRESLAGGSRFVFMGFTPDGGYKWQGRSITDYTTFAKVAGTARPPNAYVRLVREGNWFYGYYSADGITWTQASKLNKAFASDLYIGLVIASGSSTELNTATVNVVPEATNPAPTVALTSPASGASFTAPATINCAASVTANGHTITKVQFYNGTALLGEDLSAPYSFAWNNVSAGSYSLSARAVYDSGSTVTSPAASVSVAGSLPAPWKTMDIGSVGMTGSATSLDSVFTLRGAGNIGGTADSFRYVYQPMSGDGGIRVSLQAPQTAADGAVGVMIRESLTGGSRFVFMGFTPDGGYKWQGRSITDYTTFAKVAGTARPPNAYVRLVREGNWFYGYYSADGITWTQASSLYKAFASDLYIGLVIASGSSTELNAATVNVVTVVP